MNTRRDFLAAAGASAILASTHTAFAQAESKHSNDSSSDYGFSPGLIYLNTGSAGPTPRAVLDRTIEAWNAIEQNPVHNEYSMDGVLGKIEKVRELAASFLGCTADELLFTRSTSEAMNTVAQSIRLKAGDRVVMTDQEHEGGSDGWRYRSERDGIIVDKVAIPMGEHDPQAIVQRFADAIRPETRVLSFAHILFTTGLRMPVAELAVLARSRKLLCIVDGAQAAGATPIDVKALGCHAYATTGHKWLMGPKGVGMLYINRDAQDEIKPVQWIGGKRYVDNSVGVGPLPLVAGLGAAIEIANQRGVANIEQHNMALRKRAFDALSQIAAVKVMSLPSGPMTSALLSLSLPPKFADRVMLEALRKKHNIITRNIPAPPFSGLRIAPHLFNAESDIDAFVAALKTELG